MRETVSIQLQPLGKRIEVERGSALRDTLFDFGLEFPCGGHGRCRACRIKVIGGQMPATAGEMEILSPGEIAGGWRLACRCRAESDAALEINQWVSTILSDDSTFEFKPQPGLGIAVDLGTTTIVAQLVDLQTGCVQAVKTLLNPQAAYGSDVMSRVQTALTAEGRAKMRDLVCGCIGRIVDEIALSSRGTGEPIARVVIVGNTAMHHLFCGIDISPLAHYPFEPAQKETRTFSAGELHWNLPGEAEILFLHCIGGFVGSDILSGILATGMHASEDPIGLIDLGTNGEVVIGNRRRLLCASTAAGPAFEGARIQMGMRAATGAISEVSIDQGKPRCRVLGGGRPRGICGSGLVDAVAAGLDLGVIQAGGRFAGGSGPWNFCPPVGLTQGDIRELQLAKGAIAAAIQLLLRRWGVEPGGIRRLYLAGAFGNYVDRTSARRIGLLNFSDEQIVPAGNTALLGAKISLFEAESAFQDILGKTEHVPLSADPEFESVFVESLAFP